MELCGELRARVNELQVLSESRIMLQACAKLLTDLQAAPVRDYPRVALIVQTLTTMSYVANFSCAALVERFHILEAAWGTDAQEYAFRIQYYCLLALANQSAVSECADQLLECIVAALNSGHLAYFLTPISLAYYNQRVHLAELAGRDTASAKIVLIQFPFLVLDEDDGLDDDERFARDFE